MNRMSVIWKAVLEVIWHVAELRRIEAMGINVAFNPLVSATRLFLGALPKAWVDGLESHGFLNKLTPEVLGHDLNIEAILLCSTYHDFTHMRLEDVVGGHTAVEINNFQLRFACDMASRLTKASIGYRLFVESYLDTYELFGMHGGDCYEKSIIDDALEVRDVVNELRLAIDRYIENNERDKKCEEY